VRVSRGPFRRSCAGAGQQERFAGTCGPVATGTPFGSRARNAFPAGRGRRAANFKLVLRNYRTHRKSGFWSGWKNPRSAWHIGRLWETVIRGLLLQSAWWDSGQKKRCGGRSNKNLGKFSRETAGLDNRISAPEGRRGRGVQGSGLKGRSRKKHEKRLNGKKSCCRTYQRAGAIQVFPSLRLCATLVRRPVRLIFQGHPEVKNKPLKKRLPPPLEKKNKKQKQKNKPRSKGRKTFLRAELRRSFRYVRSHTTRPRPRGQRGFLAGFGAAKKKGPKGGGF